MDVELVAWSRGWGYEEALGVYARTWPERDIAEQRENFWRYAGYPDFHGLLALVAGEPVGMGYGARSFPGVPWHDLVAPVLGADHPALQDAWRLVELAVVPEQRRAGIGLRLHDALLALAARDCARALLSTSASNLPARTLYERQGWRYIDRAFYAPGVAHPYVTMARELGGAAIVDGEQ